MLGHPFVRTIWTGLEVELMNHSLEMQTVLFLQSSCKLILLILQPPSCRLEHFDAKIQSENTKCSLQLL